MKIEASEASQSACWHAEGSSGPRSIMLSREVWATRLPKATTSKFERALRQ